MNVCLHGEIIYKWIKKAKITMNAHCRLTDSWFIKSLILIFSFFFFFQLIPHPSWSSSKHALGSCKALTGQGSPLHYVLFYPVFALSISVLLLNCCSAAFILIWEQRVWKTRPSQTPLAPSICLSFFSSLLYSHTDYLLVMCVIFKFSSCALKMKIIFWGEKR